MNLLKYRLCFLAMLVFSQSVKSQTVPDNKIKIGIEIIGSAFADSKRWFYYNGNDAVYTEIRLNLRLSKTVEAGIFLGHEYKSYIYFKETALSELPLFMDRQYLPAGIYGRINITDIFTEKLKWIKKREKWDIYNHVIIARMNGYDRKDERDDGQNILYKYPYVIQYGKVYLGLLVGLKYYPTSKLYFFIEAGDGAMMNVQIGGGLKF